MNKQQTVKLLFASTILGTSMLSALGCSTDENPITPDKMMEIRKKEAQERANFQPPSAPPKPTTGG